MFAALQRSLVSQKEKKCVSFADTFGQPLVTTMHYLTYEPIKIPSQDENSPFDMEEYVKFLDEEDNKAKAKLFTSVIPTPILTNYTNALTPIDVALYNLWSTSSPLHASASGFSGMLPSQNTAFHKPLRR